jgi:hypothetical protein
MTQVMGLPLVGSFWFADDGSSFGNSSENDDDDDDDLTIATTSSCYIKKKKSSIDMSTLTQSTGETHATNDVESNVPQEQTKKEEQSASVTALRA